MSWGGRQEQPLASHAPWVLSVCLESSLDNQKHPAHTSNMKAAIYTRLSKDRTGLSENCAIQLRECRDYIQSQGWSEVLALEENDTSASKFSTKPRPKYEHLVAAIEQGEIQVVVVTEMTRLYRRMEQLLELIKLGERTSLRRIQTTDDQVYDLSTPEGIHAAIAVVNNAMLESAKLSKRQTRKKAARAAEGKYLGGYRAYGYEGALYDDDGNLTNKGRINIALIPAEVANVRACVERLIAGERITTIIRDMNENGVPSPAGKQWTIGNFKRTITRKRYVIFDASDPEHRGTLEYYGKESRAQWPGLISREQYEMMMTRFEATKQQWAHGLQHGKSYMLSGMLFCECGAHMIGSRRSVGDGYVRRYRCRKFDNHGLVIGCGTIFRMSDPVDLLVTEAVIARFDIPEVAQALAAQDDTGESSELFDKLTYLQSHRKEIVAEYGRGEHSREDYRALLTAADDAISAIRAQLAKYTKTRSMNVVRSAQELRESFETASIDWKQQVIGLVVERVILHPSKFGGEKWKGYKFDPDSVEIVWRHSDIQQVIANLCRMIRISRSRFALAA